ncbi:MAG: amidohydrolase family protein [Planctomycetes bacterium]|nr:amidohydrolase family protein [Planctomycetota bacterium]
MADVEFEPPMIIDMHAHLHEPGTTKWAEVQRIDRTVLLSGPDSNEEVLEFCRKSGGRFIPYCRVRVDDVPEACDRLREFAGTGFRGVKFQPMTERFLPHEDRMYPVWETIQELGLPITSHAGAVHFGNHCINWADPSGWSQVAWDFPELTIVIAHMGGNYHYEALAAAEACPNVYLDTAFLQHFCSRMLPRVEPAELVLRAIRYAGAGKIVFASEGMTPDFIWNCNDIQAEERKRIFWKNALEILGEPEV